MWSQAARVLHQPAGPVEEILEVDPHERGGHHPEDRERRVAPPDGRLPEEDRAEPALARQLLELGAGVGDRREATRRARPPTPRRSRGGTASRASSPTWRRRGRASPAGRGTPPARRTAAGCVVSRTWKRSLPNVRRSTSGARLEPPMPSSTTSAKPAVLARRTKRARGRAPACAAARRASRATAPRRARSTASRRVPRGARPARRSRASPRGAAHAVTSSPDLARMPSSSSAKESANFSTPSRSSVRVTSS